ncbi:sigma-70 family RNA polymerase sigma factor [Clostridium sp. A1-XYC3]|uniref:Sigma-70 family RNA polymerase sigma factor n=1 Tax=Clostridium tanneri TaxID=3037988 RepID=A0ABU4JVK5_9CLOT|nr:sigma-70 family RNA polymerase sigma factor [Clostridium sp. A1-XYC3]MDW8802141.1 sigma-70 family RNA polymerase sigma factor [Clostridium sp. A1-XYC3]
MIQKAQRNDKNALEEIVKIYKPYIIKIARSIYINGYETEDLIQIGVIALVKAVKRFQLERGAVFTAFAVIVIKNAFNEELRKIIGKRWDEKFKCSLNNVTEEGKEFIEMLASEEDIEEEVVLKEQIILLRKVMSKLPEKDREIIQWFYFENRSLKEYSELKGISANLAAQRKGRAMEKLKRYFFLEYK